MNEIIEVKMFNAKIISKNVRKIEYEFIHNAYRVFSYYIPVVQDMDVIDRLFEGNYYLVKSGKYSDGTWVWLNVSDITNAYKMVA